MTNGQKERLESLLKIRRNLDINIQKRVRAILSLNEGVSVSDTATALGVCKATVRNWFKLFGAHGWRWFVKDYGRRRGSSCKLDCTQLKLLYKQLHDDPRQSLREVQAWIKKQFGMTYSLSGVRLLVRALGYVFKRSRVIPRVPDVQVQREWQEGFNLEKSRAPKDSVFLFADAVHPRHRGDPAGAWVRKDAVPAVQQASGRQGMNVFGVLEEKTGRFFWLEDERVNSDTFIKMLKILKRKYQGAPRIHVIVDNAKYNRSKAVREWIGSQPKMKTMAGGRKGQQPEIRLCFLPPYCPHFNKIERLWRVMRKQVTENRVQSNAEEFKRALRKFFSSVHRNWKKYRTYVGAKFRIIDKRKYRIIS